jgi:hypothetical protein
MTIRNFIQIVAIVVVTGAMVIGSYVYGQSASSDNNLSIRGTIISQQHR